MHHAVVAGLMVVFALAFTSCTASLVQIWAVARQPQTQFEPPPDPVAPRRHETAAASRAKSANDRQPRPPAGASHSPDIAAGMQAPKT